MGRLSRNWFVLGASGGISLCMKMETYYQKNYLREQRLEEGQPEASIPLAYETEPSPKEKERILKGLYSTIDLLEKLLYETKQKSFKRS
jgi:hypothetical protein